MSRKPAVPVVGDFSETELREAALRGMEPADYRREMGECVEADVRLAAIDKKKLDEMREEALEPAEVL